MTDVLRESLGFDGILFTDALRMGALTQGYGGGEVAVLAIAAGSDVLLAPADIGESLEAVLEAVDSGRLTRARIDESVHRLLIAKARLGLHRTRTVDPRWVATVVGSGDHNAAARTASAGAITLVRDDAGAVPFGGGLRMLSVSFAREGDLLAGRTFNGTIRAFNGLTRTARVGPDTPWPVYDSLLQVAEEVDAIVVGAYLPPRSGAGATQLPLEFRTFLERAASAREDGFALISFGNPYLLTAVPRVGTYMVAWGDREHPQEAAARALVGAAAIGGRLPISIPPLHRIGTGLTRSALSDVAAVAAGEIDPLQEAGFIPGAVEAEEAETVTEPTGGPGRWMPADPLPECSSHPGSQIVLDVDPSDNADSFCRIGDIVATPREVDPTAVGMSPDSLAALDDFIAGALADSAASGASLAVVRRGQLVRLRGYGRLDWDPAAPPVTPASIFDLASLTKVIGTTSAAMVLAQRGAIDLDGRVVDYLPWWSAGDPRKGSVTLRHLLLHQAGLPPFRRFFLELEGREAYQEAIGALPLDYVPGDSTVYSDIGLMTLGFVVESVSDRPLDEFLRGEIWSPLGMVDTDFNPSEALWDRVATTEVDESFRGLQIHGEVHDENAHAIGGVVGHAGLFSSARDLAVFAQMMLDRGTAGACTADLGSGFPCHRARFRPVTVFQPGWVDAFTRRHSETSSRAMGWDTPSARSSAGDYFTHRAFGHTGYTGTSIWIDPTLDVAVVLLTNRVNPTRENTKHIPLRRGVHDRVAQAIVDRPILRREP